MNFEQATNVPLSAFEDDEVHLAGTVSPQAARRMEMRMQPEQQQAQRVALGGSAYMSMRLDGGPVAYTFTPHGYHNNSRSGEHHRL